jgi:hypothetical protein
MRPTKKIIPNICISKEGVPALYDGYVIINVPTYDERAEFFMVPEMDDMLDLAAKKKREGGTNSEIIQSAQDNLSVNKTMALMKNIKNQLPKWVVEVNIKRLDDGFVFNCLESVKYDSEVGAICQEIVNDLIGKYRYGNPNSPQS